DMETRVYTSAQWEADPATAGGAVNSGAAYNPGSNTLYINGDRIQGGEMVPHLVHEMGHFAEKFYLGDEFTQQQWEQLTDEQRAQAWEQYSGEEADGAELIGNRQARSEWVSFQIARVLRG